MYACNNLIKIKHILSKLFVLAIGVCHDHCRMTTYKDKLSATLNSRKSLNCVLI